MKAPSSFPADVVCGVATIAHQSRAAHDRCDDRADWREDIDLLGPSGAGRLVRVDYATQQRTIKTSGRRYADIVAAHSDPVLEIAAS